MSQKWLKTDGYMQRGALQAYWILFPTVWHLSRLSQGRTQGQGRPKRAKNVLKWRTFEITGWITGKQLKIDGYIYIYIYIYICCDEFNKHWIFFSSMWHLPRLSQGRTQLTHVPLAIAILLGICRPIRIQGWFVCLSVCLGSWVQNPFSISNY